MKTRLAIRIGVMAVCAALTLAIGCSRKTLKNDLVGNYVDDYPYGRETLALTSDGKFVQIFTPKDRSLKTASATGSWNVDDSNLILHDSLLIGAGYGDGLNPDYADRKHGGNVLDIVSAFGNVRLRVGVNSQYRGRKQ
jgi:hypothetical protein